MKIVYKIVVLLIAIFSIASCVDEQSIKVDPSFILSYQRDGRTTAIAGTPFYVIPRGSGEFLTLYDGTKGHEWGVEGAKGKDFDKSDSLDVKFDSIGHYSVSLVATSANKFGKTESRLVKTVDVTVVDERNSITKFFINSADKDVVGSISNNNEILFSLPDITTNFTFKPVFVLASNSKACTVMVNGVLQVSGITETIFAKNVPVVYTVKSPEGVEKTYSVTISTYPSSAENKLLKFNLSGVKFTNGFGEVGVIDEANKTITLTANYASKLSSVKLVVESSYASVVKINSATFSERNPYSLTNSTIVKVTAQDLINIAQYRLVLNTQDPVTDFTFDGFVPAPVRVIDVAAKTINIDISKGTDITKLKAIWKGSLGTVTLKYGTAATDSIQTNGVSVNDFTTPQKFTFYKGQASRLSSLIKGDEYTVTVNLK